jgi:hypothetical protein
LHCSARTEFKQKQPKELSASVKAAETGQKTTVHILTAVVSGVKKNRIEKLKIPDFSRGFVAEFFRVRWYWGYSRPRDCTTLVRCAVEFHYSDVPRSAQ